VILTAGFELRQQFHFRPRELHRSISLRDIVPVRPKPAPITSMVTISSSLSVVQGVRLAQSNPHHAQDAGNRPIDRAARQDRSSTLLWHTMSARRRVATERPTTSRPTSGSWRDGTSAWTGRRGAAPSPRYELTCSSSVRARRFTISTAASLRRGSSGPSSFPTVPST
jgi:hypothetical protein